MYEYLESFFNVIYSPVYSSIYSFVSQTIINFDCFRFADLLCNFGVSWHLLTTFTIFRLFASVHLVALTLVITPFSFKDLIRAATVLLLTESLTVISDMEHPYTVLVIYRVRWKARYNRWSRKSPKCLTSCPIF